MESTTSIQYGQVIQNFYSLIIYKVFLFSIGSEVEYVDKGHVSAFVLLQNKFR